MTISIPQIENPHFVYGDTGEGVGRGPGKDGDIIGRDPQPGEEGSEGENTPSDGIRVSIDMEEVLKFMEEDLKLPNLKPKPNETFEEVKIRYNNISKVGLNSLRHVRRTIKEAIKRTCALGDKVPTMMVPGSKVPVKVVTPIKSDFRFRQYKEVKIPASNAVIFFARDFSGSMVDYRCDIVNDMTWWLDCWIKRFYKKVEHCYFIHDVDAKEVTEDDFYRIRNGGGTQCSSVFDLMAEQVVNRYPPSKLNIYVFYFTDGENISSSDNDRVVKTLTEKLGPDVANLVGVVQVCCSSYHNSVKKHIDDSINLDKSNLKHIKTVSIGADSNTNSWGAPNMSEEERNQQIIDGIRNLLSSGANNVKA